MNRIILIGRLTRDPEIKYVGEGTAMARFTLAVDRPYTNKGGERETDFINIVAWRRLAEICADYLAKGRLTAVEGRLEIQSYTNSEGEQRKAAQVVADNVRFLEPKPKEENTGISDDDSPF